MKRNVWLATAATLIAASVALAGTDYGTTGREIPGSDTMDSGSGAPGPGSGTDTGSDVQQRKPHLEIPGIEPDAGSTSGAGRGSRPSGTMGDQGTGSAPTDPR
jgi:hypothetical protein